MCDGLKLLSHYTRYGGYLTCSSCGMPDLEAMIGALEAFDTHLAPRTARCWKQTLSSMLDVDDNLVFFNDDVRMLRFPLAKIALVYHSAKQVLFATPQLDNEAVFDIHRVVFRSVEEAHKYSGDLNLAAHRAQLTPQPSPPRQRRNTLLSRFFKAKSNESLPETSATEPLYDTRTLAGLSQPSSAEPSRRGSVDSGCFDVGHSTSTSKAIPRAGALSPLRPKSTSPATLRSRTATITSLAALPTPTSASLNDLRCSSEELDVNVLMLDREDEDQSAAWLHADDDESSSWVHAIDWQEAQAKLEGKAAGAFLLRCIDEDEYVLSLKRAGNAKATHVPMIKTKQGYILSGCDDARAASPIELVKTIHFMGVPVMGTCLTTPVVADLAV